MQPLLDRLARDFDQGRLEFRMPSGECYHIGSGDPSARLRFKDAGALLRLLINPELRFGELYMDGAWEPDPPSDPPDLRPILRIALQLARHRARKSKTRALVPLGRFWRELNVIERAKANARHHYDLDKDFYASFLDAEMHYSCAFFERDDADLDTAQRAKAALIVRKLDLSPGAQVLDIGCGWGALARHLARTLDAEVLGISLSPEQVAWARTLAERSGLTHRLRFECQDYRQVQGNFDAVVSVGMFEHVGRPFYRRFFECVRDRLKSDGTALIHTIGRSGPPGKTNPWIRRYIFPGGYVPAASEVMSAIEQSGLILCDVEVLRGHYALTLAAWNQRFQARRAEHVQRFGERFCRMWEFYLQAAQCAFEVDELIVFQFQLARTPHRLPKTRAYLLGDSGRSRSL